MNVCYFFQELQQKIAEVRERMDSIASRRKHVAESLSGRLPDQAKTAEQMQDDLKAATDLKVGSVQKWSLYLHSFSRHSIKAWHQRVKQHSGYRLNWMT